MRRISQLPGFDASSLLVALAVVTVASVAVFLRLQLPSLDLDADYQSFVSYAFRERFVFGKDIVFTYGPTAFLEFPITDPVLLPWKVTCLVALSVVLALVWTQTVRDAGLSPLWAPASFLVAVSTDFAPAAYAFMIVVCAWVFRRRERLDPRLLAAVVLVLVLFGFTKFTMLTMCLGLLVAVAVDGVLSREYAQAAALPAFVLITVGAWLAWFGDLGSLARYVSTSWAVSEGFNNAMQWPGPAVEVVRFAVGSALLLVITALRDASWSRRVTHALALASILFVLHKHAFVRHDIHGLIAARGLFFAVTLYAVVSLKKELVAVRLAAPLLWIFAVMALAASEEHHTQRTLPQVAQQTARRMLETGHRLATLAGGDDTLERAHVLAMQDLAKARPLPALKGTVDIYPIGQTLLLAHGLSLSPRPVFHSYVACTDALLKLNAAHLASEAAPQWLLWRLSDTDGRLLATDEAASWLEVLRRYDVEGAAGDHLVLHKRPQPVDVSRRSLMKVKGTIGEQVILPPTSGLVWMKIRVRPTWWGRLVGFLYKPAGLTLRLRSNTGGWQHARFLPATGRTGFLSAPLVTSTAMFGELLRDRAAVGELGGRSDIVQLEPDPGRESMFAPTFEIVLEQLAFASPLISETKP